MSGTVVVFAKVPGKGIAKTRIAQSHGAETAARVYKELLTATASSVGDVEHHIAFTGSDRPGELMAVFPEARSFFPQNGENLGARLTAAFRYLYNRGYDGVCAVGCDCPWLSPDDCRAALRALDQGNEVVIGPASDGGYYLVGCRHNALDVFTARQWGRSGLFQETMGIISSRDYSFTLLRELGDVDYMKDYQQWKAKSG